MIPYFLLLLIPLFFCFIQVDKRSSTLYHIQFRLAGGNTQNNVVLQSFFWILLLLLVCRADTIGRDLPNYTYMWRRDAGSSLREIWKEWNEPLFKLYNYVMYRITDTFQWYLTITAILTVAPTAYVYCQDKRHGYVKAAIFVNMSTFVMLFSGLRQSIAIALGVLGFELIKRKKHAAFFAVAFLASLVHTSGFMVFALFPLYHARFQKKHLLILVPLMGLLFVFNQYVFLFLTRVFGNMYDGSLRITQTSARGSLILFVLFAALSYVISDESKMDAEAIALRNILLAAVCFQSFASLHSLAMRMNYYFIIFIPLAVGKSFSLTEQRWKNVADLAEVVLCIYFTVNFCYSTFISYVTGISALDTIPYIAFWNA